MQQAAPSIQDNTSKHQGQSHKHQPLNPPPPGSFSPPPISAPPLRNVCRPSAVCRLWDVFQDKCHYFLRKPAWEKFKGKQACQSQFLNACLSLGFSVSFLLPCNLSSCWMGGSLAQAQLGATGSFLLVMLWIHLLIQHLQT